MIDLRQRLKESVSSVQSYGQWVSYGGLVVMVGSVVIFFIEFMKMIHIARLPGVKGSGVSSAEVEEELDQLEKENEERLKSSNLFVQIQSDIENEKAVLMGNKESVMFIYMLNCVICVLFFIKGVLMWQASKPTLATAKFLQNNNYDVN